MVDDDTTKASTTTATVDTTPVDHHPLGDNESPMTTLTPTKDVQEHKQQQQNLFEEDLLTKDSPLEFAAATATTTEMPSNEKKENDDEEVKNQFVDLEISKDESTLAWQDTATKPNDGHLIESPNSDGSLDPWQEENTSLLENSSGEEERDGSPLLTSAATAATAAAAAAAVVVVEAPMVYVDHHDDNVVPPREEEKLDSDISHMKGFHNASDSNEIADLQVLGKLPDWLVCEHFTVGPGTYDIKYMRKMEVDGELQHVSQFFTFGHWFDSLPLVNRFDIHGQRNSISYRNRLTCRRLIDKVRDNHGYSPRHPNGLFSTKTNQSVLTKIIGVGNNPRPDYEPCGARILPSIPGVEGRLFCLNLANHIQELDPFDMRPTRVLTWDEVNPAFKGYSSCPNGQFDERTGEYINFSMDVGYQSTKYTFFSISDRQPKGIVIGSVTAPTAYVNHFSTTPNYIVLAIFPMLATGGAVKFAWNESILESFAFNGQQPTLFYVLSRKSGQHVATFRSEACFAFHHVNAFEDDQDNVYVDIICYPDDTIAHQLVTESLRNPAAAMKPPRLTPSELRRYVLHSVEVTGSRHPGTTNSSKSGLFGFRKAAPATAIIPEATFEKWLQPSFELPQVNPNYKQHQYTYVYGLGFSASSSITDGQIWDTIIKANVKERGVAATWHCKGCFPSEAVFVPRPSHGANDDVAEDDGVLLSIVMDSARMTSFLLVLDASTLNELARAYLGTLVPISFAHGSYRLYTH